MTCVLLFVRISMRNLARVQGTESALHPAGPKTPAQNRLNAKKMTSEHVCLRASNLNFTRAPHDCKRNNTPERRPCEHRASHPHTASSEWHTVVYVPTWQCDDSNGRDVPRRPYACKSQRTSERHQHSEHTKLTRHEETY